MSRLPAASADTMLDAEWAAATNYFMSIHSADPGTTGASEITGYTGNRPIIQFAAASASSKVSTDAQNFAAMPAEAGGIPYFGLWTAATGGTYMGGGTTSGLSGAIGSGATVAFATGAVTLGLT